MTSSKTTANNAAAPKMAAPKIAASKVLPAKAAAPKIATWAMLVSDKALGAVGGSLAVASLGFGVYMITYGPPPGTFGNSKDFTVFAQLAPRNRDKVQPKAPPAAAPAPAEDLDMTATASIPTSDAKSAAPSPMPATSDDADAFPNEAAIIPSVTLEAAKADAATIAIGGRARTVRVGDKVPGAGEILEIRLGRFPSLKTSRGYIVAARQE